MLKLSFDGLNEIHIVPPNIHTVAHYLLTAPDSRPDSRSLPYPVDMSGTVLTAKRLIITATISTNSKTPRYLHSSSPTSAATGSSNFPPLPYHVHRTASQKLPIYHLAKRGGNLHQTKIRKIEGDVEKLKDEIRTALDLKEELVVINHLTGHIIIKVGAIKFYCMMRGRRVEIHSTTSIKRRPIFN